MTATLGNDCQLHNIVQTNLKLALQAHSDTLRDIRGFWRELCSKKTTFSSLSEVSVPLQCSQVFDIGIICIMFSACAA